VLSTQILIEVEVEVVKPHFEVDMEVRMVKIINMKVSFMKVDEETLEEKEVIQVNNQITTQIAIIVGNLGTWQKTVINGVHKKRIMHQLLIKVMSNCL
jgi:hypothetical protein